MGNLTTITFRNDSYGCIKDNPKEVHQLILKAMNGEQLRKNRETEPIGSSANPVIIQKYRHADDATLYLHSGNTVTDVYKAKSKCRVHKQSILRPTHCPGSLNCTTAYTLRVPSFYKQPNVRSQYVWHCQHKH